MATFSLTKAIRGDKPHSSISDWIEILSSDRYKENSYDGIPELVESINLQANEGPGEASRAIRKKLKYGNVHRQLRALTILKAVVENCNARFQSSFADDMLVHRLKTMAEDPLTDEGVKKKLMSLLATWHRQFKDDPKMATVSGLWVSCGGGARRPPPQPPIPHPYDSVAREKEDRRYKERLAREEEKRKEKERKEREKAERRKPATSSKPRRVFDFEKEKPQIINSIADASQMAINLTNALKLVNREQEKIQDNARVQECLGKAKAARKSIVRYIQLVENEDLIGTLLDANERIITAMQLYDQLLKSAEHDSDEEVSAAKAASQMKELSLSEGAASPVGELSKLQGKQRAAIQRSISRSSLDVNHMGVSRPAPAKAGHPDLKDLQWGSLDQDAVGSLPPPIRPRSASEEQDNAKYGQATLSDYSDYSSTDDERDSHRASMSTSKTSEAASPSYSRDGTSGSRSYSHFIQDDDDEVVASGDARKGLLDQDDDPFADPFGDSGAVSDVETPNDDKKRIDWR